MAILMFGSTAAPTGPPSCTAPACSRRRRPGKSSSSTPTSIRTKPHISAISGTRSSATLSSACCVRQGATVEVQNYIDNTGVQVADVVVGFHYLEHKSPADVQELIARGTVRLPVLGPVRAHLQPTTKSILSPLHWRAETLHAIEAGEGELAELGHLVADAIVQAHLATMLRLESFTTCCRAKARSCT